MSKSYPELHVEFTTKLRGKLSIGDARRAVERVVDIANSRTRELSHARNKAFTDYLKINKDFNEQWLQAWVVNRDLTLAAEGIEV
jgi:hypothetical protein